MAESSERGCGNKNIHIRERLLQKNENEKYIIYKEKRVANNVVKESKEKKGKPEQFGYTAYIVLHICMYIHHLAADKSANYRHIKIIYIYTPFKRE